MTHPFEMYEPNNTVPNIITLLGGGSVVSDTLQIALSKAPYLVAADGGADYAHTNEIPVTHIVGDFDSLTNFEIWQDKGVNLIRLSEQDSTDFEKCLYTFAAKVYLCVGFLGRRLDHSLAALRSLLVYKDRFPILLGDGDITFRCPEKFAIEMTEGDYVSLFPMGRVDGLSSKGLRWSIEGLEFSPSGQIGTSNMALGGPVEINLKGQEMLIILPIQYLDKVIDQLAALSDAPSK